jgi:hypothetical protein
MFLAHCVREGLGRGGKEGKEGETKGRGRKGRRKEEMKTRREKLKNY